MQLEAVIGLEIHAQLQTDSKIFCSCPTTFGAPPNTHTCPICLGMPGVLPVLNRKVVEYAIKMGLATNCRIASKSVFARKNYFYPDLPKGYQISMFEQPLAEHGWVDISVNGRARRIGLTRIHMEEDAGKLIHDEFKAVSYIDFNRTGVPLIEIVSEPDMRSPEEAAAYLKTVHDILVYLKICDGSMEEGSFRCDANISLRPAGQKEYGIRTELKNMNSFRNVARALEYEIRRQQAVIEDGESIIQETRLWNDAKGVTESMRGKEESHDYRYFPDPDLVPVVVGEEWIAELESSLPELPGPKRDRFVRDYGLPEQIAEGLTSSRDLADYFEETVKILNDPKTVGNWIMSELMRELNEAEQTAADCPIRPGQLAELLKLIRDGRISGKMAKGVFSEMYRTGKDPAGIIQAQGLEVVADSTQLEPVIRDILAANPDEVREYRAGKEKLMGFFVGQVMKKTKGQADPKAVNELLKTMLKA